MVNTDKHWSVFSDHETISIQLLKWTMFQKKISVSETWCCIKYLTLF